MIKQVVSAGKNAGIPVSICGELAGDLKLTPQLVEMGVSELSVTPGMILSLRKKIREIH